MWNIFGMILTGESRNALEEPCPSTTSSKTNPT